MRAVIFVALLVLAVATAEQCHPNCKWQCDDPSCPAVCHPVCERPQCQIQCEETPCAKCVVHCQKPTCSIRCPKEQCEKDDCPKCESICQPAVCHTTCSAPEPKCSPVCEELVCNNKCAKPTNCARPKCELQCEKAACEAAEPQCCPCSASNTQVAITAANTACQPADTCSAAANEQGVTILKPSFLEVFHTFQHARQEGKEECCPCSGH